MQRTWAIDLEWLHELPRAHIRPVERAPFCVPMYPLIYDDLQHWLWDIFLNPIMKLIEVTLYRSGFIHMAFL